MEKDELDNVFPGVTVKVSGDDKYPIYLESENRKIRLVKENMIQGQYGLSQAIFKLEEHLCILLL